MTHPSTPRVKRDRTEQTTPMRKAPATELAEKPSALRTGPDDPSGATTPPPRKMTEAEAERLCMAPERKATVARAYSIAVPKAKVAIGPLDASTF